MRITALLIFSFFLLSCDQFSFPRKDDRINSLNNMLQQDVDFSARASAVGYRKAVMEFMEDESVLLRNSAQPIIGADAVSYISSLDDSSFQVSWDPQGGDVSASGDMGYTFGIYELRTDTEKQEGNYVTIWRKQSDGSWKYVLNAETQGLARPVSEP